MNRHSCPVCFFRDKTQRKLKEKCFNINRFEEKLVKYKKLFVQGVKNMDSLSKCGCYSKYDNPGIVKWTDYFRNDLKTNIGEIEKVFSEITACYIDFIEKSQKIALDNFEKFLKNNKLKDEIENYISYAKLFFRGTKKGSFDETDTKNFFHIPFSKRHLIGNQRFSISGQPMSYLGSSVLTIEKELEVRLDELSIAAFLPKFSFYNQKILDLKNYFNDVIEISLPELSANGSPDYYDTNTVPNHQSIKKDLKKTILMQICTFPTEYKGSFIAEYVLPQMLTAVLYENDYSGIIFPSTKDFSNLSDNHRFSSHHINLGLFVSYDRKEEFDKKLLDSFFVYTIDGSESFNLTIKSIFDEIDSLKGKIDKSNPNNGYDVAIAQLKLQIGYLADSSLDGQKYFDTKIGKVELEYYMKMLRGLKKVILNKV